MDAAVAAAESNTDLDEGESAGSHADVDLWVIAVNLNGTCCEGNMESLAAGIAGTAVGIFECGVVGRCCCNEETMTVGYCHILEEAVHFAVVSCQWVSRVENSSDVSEPG